MSQRGSPSRSSGRGSQSGAPSPSPSRSRSGSVGSAGSHGSGPSSSAGAPGRGQFPAGLGYDPARFGKRNNEINKRIDLPPEAYMAKPADGRFTKRPGFNNNRAGTKCQIEVNQFRVSKLDASKTIYQYDITVAPAPDKLGPVAKKLWNHPKVIQEREKLLGKTLWLFDGTKLAWSTVQAPRELKVRIDLDEDKPNQPKRDRRNEFMFVMRLTTRINLHAIKAYLEGQMSWDNSILEGMNFLDHLIRQEPSERLVMIKRNFYNPAEQPRSIDSVVQVAIGAYSSIRMNQSIYRGGFGLGINCDAAHTAMWIPHRMMEAIKSYLEVVEKVKVPSANHLANMLRPVKRPGANNSGMWDMSETFRLLRRLYRLKFKTTHVESAGKAGAGQEQPHTFSRLLFEQNYGADGATARTVMINWPSNTSNQVSIYDYFKQKYNIVLSFPHLPLIETNKRGTFLPIELCTLLPMQRYQYKLTPEQTSKMIKIAVSRPNDRKVKIMDRRATLKWETDPYLRQFGVAFDSRFSRTDALVLPPPTIKFQNGDLKPGLTGRWNIQGKRFIIPSKRPLTNWGFVTLEGAVSKQQLETFANNFVKIYQGHGGLIQGRPMFFDENESGDAALSVERCYERLMSQCSKTKNCPPPDLLFVILAFKNSNVYQRVKKVADCRYGLLTQCLLGLHVKNNQAQYHSNVCMKVNAKMGGGTNRLPGPPDRNVWHKTKNTMVLGADVTHSTPGVDNPSIAAVVASMDTLAATYAASCQTNGWNVELLTPTNIEFFLNQLLPMYIKSMGALPEHIIYFRDGVSEGQFAQVVEYEVGQMKKMFVAKSLKPPKFTVIVATKRHHIRFFPGTQGDRNENPKPGTLVEKEVTHPFQWDFYLCSHVAIQGTARPVHYHVIMDEIGWNPEDLQQMIYEQCYTYARATTPVSLHPAIYYAHLAGGRARTHENVLQSEGPRTGGKAVEYGNYRLSNMPDDATSVGADRSVASNALLPLGGSKDAHKKNTDFIKSTMWYI